MDKIFGRPSRAEKPRVVDNAGTSFQETEPSVHATESAAGQPARLPSVKKGVVHSTDVVRSQSIRTVRETTPLSTVNIATDRIDAQTLERNLQNPVFDDPLLPNLPQVKRDEPYLYGAGHTLPPKTNYVSSGVSEGGVDDLRTNPVSVEAALQNPGLPQATGEELGDNYARRSSAMRKAPRPNVRGVISSEDLRVAEAMNLVQSDPDDDWRRAVAAARESNGRPLQVETKTLDFGIENHREAERRIRDLKSSGGLDEVYNGRPPAMPSDDERWEAARQAAQQADEFVAQQRALILMSRQEPSISVEQEGLNAQSERVRQAMLQKILELRDMMLSEEDPDTRELMRETLERAIGVFTTSFLEKFKKSN